MTQTPPISPDFATPPKELVDRARKWLCDPPWLYVPKAHDFEDFVASLALEFAAVERAAEERGASRERERIRADLASRHIALYEPDPPEPTP